MNIYLIDDNENSHIMLTAVLSSCNQIAQGQIFNDGFSGQGHTAWCDQSMLAAALQDNEGVFLLDIHMPCVQAEQITKYLISHFASSLQNIHQDFTSLWEKKFNKGSDFQIAACLVTLARTKNLRCIIISTYPVKIDGDKTARELTKDIAHNIPICGFPTPLKPDEESLPSKVTAHQTRIKTLAETILKEAKRDSFDRAEYEWAEVLQKLNNGSWPDHPTSGTRRLFSNHPWHTAGDWLKALAPPFANEKATKTSTQAQQILNEFLEKRDSSCEQIAKMEDALIVLRAAFQGTTTTQLISTILLFHLLKNNLSSSLQTLDRFSCIAISIPENDAAKLGRFIQGLWSLCLSEDNITRKTFFASLVFSESSVEVKFWATKEDTKQAIEAANRIDGKDLRIGTAARAVKTLRDIHPVTVQNVESRVEISMNFKLANVD